MKWHDIEALFKADEAAFCCVVKDVPYPNKVVNVSVCF